MPSDFIFSDHHNGVHAFSVTLDTLGFRTVSVTDTTNRAIADAPLIDVVARSSGGGGGGSGARGSLTVRSEIREAGSHSEGIFL